MDKYLLVGYLGGLDEWYGRQRGGYYESHKELSVVVGLAKEVGLPVMVDRSLEAGMAVQLVAACAFAGVQLVNEAGEILKPTPVSDAVVKYITQKELGRIIPDGWMIEVQLNKYTAMFGEELAFPARREMWMAINDIRGFLSASAMQASQELAHSMAAQTALEESGKQLSFLSSDS
jgi:hypothetical protein